MNLPRSHRDLTVASGLLAAAERAPDKVALIEDDRHLTYGDLADRIRRVRGWMRTFLGTPDGQRIVILAPNCLEYMELVAGVSEERAIAVTLSHRLSPREIEGICRDARPALTIVHPSCAALVEPLDAVVTGPVVTLGPAYEEVLAASRPIHDAGKATEWDAFAMPYTSGTTGRPKGVMLSHRSRILTCMGMAAEYGCFSPDDQYLALAPLCHGAGFAFALASLYFGGTCIINQRYEPEALLHHLRHDGVTGVFMVPTHFQKLFELGTERLGDGRGLALKTIISNAAPLSQAMKERIVAYFGPGILHETYGSTEAGIVTNLRPPDQLRKEKCVGQAFACTEIRLLDDAGRPVPRGEVGELFSRSPFLFNGYWDRPAETDEAFRDGWVSVGDLARQDEDGFFYIVDRKKDMVISGGVNIYPREVEEVLFRHPDILDAAVVGVPDEEWGERLKAFIVPRGAGVAPDAIIAFCTEHLSRLKVPREVAFIETLPRNSNGKVLKKELRSQ